MGIDLGLRRVAALLLHLGNPHKAWYSVHVAGTNGKGSVCAYLTSILLASNIRSGRFTSPHLVHRRDSITIDGHAVSANVFDAAEAKVRAADKMHAIHATEFELLTATAFEIFAAQKVQVAVVEVGLGGRLDATNVLEPVACVGAEESDAASGPVSAQIQGLPTSVFEKYSRDRKCGVLATVITKIGLDHQSFLGDTLEKIAYQKAGIIKKGVPCVVDASNKLETLNTILQVSKDVNNDENITFGNSPLLTKALPTKEGQHWVVDTKTWGLINTELTPLLGNYQKSNLACAINAAQVLQKWFPEQMADKDTIQTGIKNTQWPGRLQWLDITSDTSKPVKVLLDGAHNPQAAEELALFLDTHLRPLAPGKAVHFVIAFTSGKDYGDIIACVVKPGDTVVTTQFGDVDSMPWIKSYSAKETADMVCSTVKNVKVGSVDSQDLDNSQLEAIKQCQNQMLTENQPVVVFGSLYLVGKVLEKVGNL